MTWRWDDDLPRSSADIEPLEGDPDSLRVAASDLRTLAGDLETARAAVVELESITEGSSWQGAGFDAFRTTVEKNPKASDVTNAQSTMSAAAEVLDRLAAAIQECQSRVDWCRQRIDALGEPAGEIPDDVRPQVESIVIDADEARENHRHHLSAAGEGFAELTGTTVHAKPPPGLFELMTTTGSTLPFSGEVQFALGIVEGSQELVQGLWSTASLVEGLSNPWNVERRTEIAVGLGQVVLFAREDPRAFLAEVGKAVVDWDTFKESPQRWLGKLVPNVATAAMSGGVAPAATAASRVAVVSARFGRISRAANKVAKVSMQIDNTFRVTKQISRQARRLFRNGPLRELANNHEVIGLLAKHLIGQQGGKLGPRVGAKGKQLTLEYRQNLGLRPVADEVPLESTQLSRRDGTPRTATIDWMFEQPGASRLIAVESKNGLAAKLERDQPFVFPEISTPGVIVTSDKLATISVAPHPNGIPRGSLLQADFHVDHWFSPVDGPSVVQQAAVQTGTEGAKIAGDDQRFDAPPNR